MKQLVLWGMCCGLFLVRSQAQCELTISPNTQILSCVKAVEEVVWTDLTGNMTAIGNNLTKNGSNGWNGGAASTALVMEGGYISSTVNETNTNRVIGLSNTNTNASITTIEYGIYLRGNGIIRVIESNTSRGDFGAYNSGDEVRIAVESGVIRYYVNGNNFYTSTVAPTLPLLVDVSLNTIGSTLENVFISHGTDGSFSAAVTNPGVGATYQWKLNGLNVGLDNPNYTNASVSDGDVLTCDFTPGLGGCGVGMETSNQITITEISLSEMSSVWIDATPTGSLCNQGRVEVVWTDLTGNLTATGNNLSKSGINAWDGGAASYQRVGNNGYITSMVNETNTNRVIGLSSTNTNAAMNSIQYGIYLRSNGIIRIMESNTSRGDFGAYSNGDEIKIAVEGGVVNYYLNGNNFYTSSVAPTLPLLVDVSLNTNGSTLEEVYVVNGIGGDFTATAVNVGASPVYQWKLNGADVGTNSPSYSNAALNVNDTITCEVTPDAAGCAVLAVTSNEITYNEVSPADNASVWIDATPTGSLCNQGRVEVVWTDLTGNLTATGNSLSKSGANGWNGGAASYQRVGNNGYMITTIDETNTNRMVGLSTVNANANYTTINYAVYLMSGGSIRVYESGSNRGNFGTYSNGDEIKIAVEGGAVNYYLNGNNFYTSSVAPTLPLLVDVSLNTNGSTLEEVYVVNGIGGNFTATALNAGPSPSYQWKLNGADVGTNSPSYSNAALNVNDIITCEVTPDAAGCAVLADVISNTITYDEVIPADNASVWIDATPTGSLCNQGRVEVVWTDLTGNLTATGNSLSKSGPNAWDGGAASYQRVGNNGYITSMVNETNTNRVIGLSSTNTNASINSVEYGIYLRSNGIIRIMESNTSRGDFGAYSNGDELRIAVENGVVKYYRNGNSFYTSSVAPSLPLLVDVSLNTNGSTLEEVYVVNGIGGNFTATALNAGPSPSYQWKLNGADVGTNSPSYSNAALNVNDIITCEVTPDAAGCAVLADVTSNTITYDEVIPADNSSVWIDATPTGSLCSEALVDVSWRDLTGNMTATGNNLNKNGANAWDGGAASYQRVGNQGYVSTIVNETNTARMFGLSSNNTNASFNTIGYAIYLMNNGNLRIYESGTNRGNFGAYSNGDELRIAVESGVVNYYRNGALLYTSAVAPVLPMLVDVSLNTNGSTLEQVTLSKGVGNEYTAHAVNAGASPTYQWKLNGLNVGSNLPTYSNPGIVPGDVITCEMTADAAGCIVTPVVSNAITQLTVPVTTHWLGLTSDWFSLSNWDNGVPTANEIAHITSQANDPLISGSDAVCGGVLIDAGATLTIAATEQLDVHGHWDNSGTFVANQSSVVFYQGCDLSASAITSENDQTFYNLSVDNENGATILFKTHVLETLTLINGDLVTNNILTLISNSAGTARLAEIPGSADIVGGVVVQRYIPAGTSGWMILSAPVMGATLQQWNDDFPTGGFPGSQVPWSTSPSITGYDETISGTYDYGFVDPTGITDPIVPGAGYFAYVVTSSAVTVDVTGPLIKGAHAFSVTYTDTGLPDDDGWNLVGNPYASAIDWDAAGWTKTNVDDAIYIYSPTLDQYTSYVGGVGINGGTNLIASSQGFFVKTNAPSPVLELTESVKTSIDESFVRSPQPGQDGILKIGLSGKGYSDETVVRFSGNATEGFDGQLDALKFFSFNSNVPGIATRSDTSDFSINSLPLLTEDLSLPLKVLVGITGTYTIELKALSNLPSSSCVILEDLVTGTQTDLRNTPTYSFHINKSTVAPRFLIHIGKPIEIETLSTVCYESSNGVLVAQGLGNGPWDYTWKDAGGTVIQSHTNWSTADTLYNLPAGIYSVEITGNTGLCGGERTEVVHLAESAAISAQIIENHTSCISTADGSILVSSTVGGTPPYTYSWSNGSNSPNVTGIPAGNYTLIVTDARGCLQEFEYTVEAGPEVISMFSMSNDTVDLSNNAPVIFSNTSTGATTYLWDFGDGSATSTLENPNHTYLTPGVYTAELKATTDACTDNSFRQVVVLSPTTNTAKNSLHNLIKVLSGENTVELVFTTALPSDTRISLYNSLGQQVLGESTVITPGNMLFDFTDKARGVYYIRIQSQEDVVVKKIIRP